MKTNKTLRSFALLGLCMLMNYASVAQKKRSAPPKPQWITMMDDPNVNYFEAVKNFNDYWQKRERPVVENDQFESVGDKEKKEALERKKKRLKADDPAVLYAFEYKRFLWWMHEMEPFVQPDGRIKGMSERVAEWKTQQEQKKLQLQKQKDSSKKKDNYLLHLTPF